MDHIKETFLEVNWDFSNAHSHYGLHKLHWYPATFIPQIPAYLIELFSKENDLVYDPFCGVGTTLVEAVRLGRSAVGVDVNHLACLIANVKLTFFEPLVLDQFQKKFLRKLSMSRKVRKNSEMYTLPMDYSSEQLNKLRYDFNHVKGWYHEVTFSDLLTLWKIICEFDSDFHTVSNITLIPPLQNHLNSPLLPKWT